MKPNVLIQEQCNLLSQNLAGYTHLFIGFGLEILGDLNNYQYQNYSAEWLFEVLTRTLCHARNTFTTRTIKIAEQGSFYIVKPDKPAVKSINRICTGNRAVSYTHLRAHETKANIVC